MINFSKISADSFIGKILRKILKIIPPNFVLPILQGRLKGKKWVIGSGVFSYWLGDYEIEKQKLFEKTVKRDDIVFDIGAQAGFYSLLAAELVGETGKVFAFEPAPINIVYLKKHIGLNKYKNIFVREAVVSDKSGFINFELGKNRFTGRISVDGGLKVSCVSLDDLIEKGDLPAPDILKIDVEGAELAVLKGASFVINKYHPDIFLSIHGKESSDELICFFKNSGYNLEKAEIDGIRKGGEIFISFKK